MTRAEFDKMMERNFKHFNVPEDNYGGLLLWIPKYKEFLSMHFGGGPMQMILKRAVKIIFIILSLISLATLI